MTFTFRRRGGSWTGFGRHGGAELHGRRWRFSRVQPAFSTLRTVNRPVLYDTNDRFSSQGTFQPERFSSPFLSCPSLAADQLPHPRFPATKSVPPSVTSFSLRKVEPAGNNPDHDQCGVFSFLFLPELSLGTGQANNILSTASIRSARRDPNAGHPWVQVPPPMAVHAGASVQKSGASFEE